MVSQALVNEQIQPEGIVQGQWRFYDNCTAREGDDCCR